MKKAVYNCSDNGFCIIEQVDGKNIRKQNKGTPKKGTLIYFADPMCSWCWGMSPEIFKLKKQYARHFDLELVMGGLRHGEEIAWDRKLTQSLFHHWNHVKRTTGQDFNYSILQSTDFVYDTEPACRAVRIIRDLAPNKELIFYHEVQRAFYMDNNNPKASDFYRPICKKLNIPFKAFRPMFLSSVYCDKVIVDFDRTRQYGVMGFPAVVLEIKGERHVITRGYSSFEIMEKKIEGIIKTKRNGFPTRLPRIPKISAEIFNFR